MKNYGKKIRDLIRSITNNSDIYDDKYMKINFNLNDNLPLKPLELQNIIIVVRFVFHEDNKCYRQVFIFFYINVSVIYKFQNMTELIFLKEYVSKTIALCECIISHYQYFLEMNFKFQLEVGDGCYGLIPKAMTFNDVVIVSVKENNYRIQDN